MAKQNTYQRFVYKIKSTRFRNANWDLSINLNEARKNDELISLAYSTTLNMIDNIVGNKDCMNKILEIKKQIKHLKREDVTKENKTKIRKLYNQLDKLQFVKDYVEIIIDKNSDYKKMYKNGFKINGIEYRRLLGTTGGVKNKTIVFVSLRVWDKLKRNIDNQRDESVPIVPAKLEAYKALTCSASVKVSTPNGILVVSDCEMKFNKDVMLLDDSDNTLPSPKLTLEKNYECSVVDNDGYGLILPSAMKRWSIELGEDYIPSGVCIRNSWTKGMVFTFDFREFARKIAHKEIVKDVWGNEHNINDIEMILTESMLKLTKAYKSINDYLEKCEKNGYYFSVTKVCPKKLEDERNLNYQFIQTYQLNEDQINKLINPTIKQFKDVLGLDRIKSLLFLRGINQDKNQFEFIKENYIKAIMIDDRMMNDTYIRKKIYKMLKKRIDEAKTGAIRVKGNYSIISGDPYLFCQHVFELEETGILNANEIYSKYWIDKGVKKIACYRAPMTNHENICTPNVVTNDEMDYWFQYMPTATILNSKDTITHELNGADKDSDGIFTTDDEILINNKRQTLPIICVQKSADKKIVEENDLFKANIDGFGDDIGTITNHATSMIQMLSDFENDSKEYKELDYRIKTMQQYQQNSIDKTKGIISKPMPKEWYDYTSVRIIKKDEYDKNGKLIKVKDSPEEIERKTFLLSILADKKPYFMIYIYPQLKVAYNKYKKQTNNKCQKLFKVGIEELIKKDKPTKEEYEFIEKYKHKMPVLMSNSLVNKIAWKIENEINLNFKEEMQNSDFDYSILYNTDYQYDSDLYASIKKLYKDYIKSISDFCQMAKSNKLDCEDAQIKKQQVKINFKNEAFKQCNNDEVLANILVDMCYKHGCNKDFAWDIAGDVFIRRLLKINNNKITYPVKDDSGAIEYSYSTYTIKIEELKMESDI